MSIPTKTLNDKNIMPAIALGTYGMEDDISNIRQVVNWAIEAGYRHIDTAKFYRNEFQIGQAIADVIEKGIVTRRDIFVTTKLWGNDHGRDQVVPALRASLERLHLDYVDLYLIHFPVSLDENNWPTDIDYLETWAGMEEAQKLGLTNSIGVSNFNSEQISRIVANGHVVPAVNQIEVNPSYGNHTLVNYCRKFHITVMGYSPFGFMVKRDLPHNSPPKADDFDLLNIAKKYRKTTFQVVLRYQIDRGIVPIPKSSKICQIKENINIFDFHLTPEEVSVIDSLSSCTKLWLVPEWSHHLYYPFFKD